MITSSCASEPRSFAVSPRKEGEVALLESPYELGATARISSSRTEVKQNIQGFFYPLWQLQETNCQFQRCLACYPFAIGFHARRGVPRHRGRASRENLR